MSPTYRRYPPPPEPRPHRRLSGRRIAAMFVGVTIRTALACTAVILMLAGLATPAGEQLVPAVGSPTAAVDVRPVSNGTPSAPGR